MPKLHNLSSLKEGLIVAVGTVSLIFFLSYIKGCVPFLQ